MRGEVRVTGRPRSVGELLATHLRRYPCMEPADVLKLLLQGAMGPAHAAPDRESARGRLLAELRDAGPGPREPLVDPVSHRDGIARVHLRPWRDAGLDPLLLLEAFLATAEAFRGSPGAMETDCLEAERILHRAGLPMAEAFSTLLGEARTLGFPPSSHSAAFREAYRPAYRVVDVSLAGFPIPASPV